jgi:uncharacterized protein (TIGR03437 family)
MSFNVRFVCNVQLRLYIYYVSRTQINFIVPDVRTGAQRVTVKNAAGTSQTVSVTVDNFAPAFFLWPNNQVVATFQDFTYAAASGTFSGVTTTPAEPGDTIILWGTDSEPRIRRFRKARSLRARVALTIRTRCR